MTTPATMKLVSNLGASRWWFEVGGARVVLVDSGGFEHYGSRDIAVKEAERAGLVVDDEGNCSTPNDAPRPRPRPELETINDFALGVRVTDAGPVLHMLRGIAPGALIPKAQALRLAAWLVVLVDPDGEAFAETLAAIEAT